MSDDNLEIIQNSQSSPEKCLHEVLAYWIKTGKAYWSVLVDSLCSSLLREDEVAEDISKRYLSKISDICIMIVLWILLSSTLETEDIDHPKTREEVPEGDYYSFSINHLSGE